MSIIGKRLVRSGRGAPMALGLSFAIGLAHIGLFTGPAVAQTQTINENMVSTVNETVDDATDGFTAVDHDDSHALFDSGASATTMGITKCYASKLKFSNDNSGIINLTLHWENAQNGSDKGSWKYLRLSGESDTLNLSNLDPANLTTGDDVWFTANIQWGDNVSCRKSTHRVIYHPDAGTTMKFHVKGGLTNRNRCRYDGNIAADCNTTNPDD